MICSLRFRILTDDLATVLVVPDKTSFRIHAELLITRSPFFEQALAVKPEESKSLEVTLPEDDPDIFAIFAIWLYGGKIELAEDKSSVSQIVRLWVLADKLQMPKLQFEAAQLLPTLKGTISAVTINWVYANTVAETPLRQAVVQVMVSKTNVTDIKTRMSQNCRDYVNDLCVEFFGRVADSPAPPRRK